MENFLGRTERYLCLGSETGTGQTRDFSWSRIVFACEFNRFNPLRNHSRSLGLAVRGLQELAILFAALALRPFLTYLRPCSFNFLAPIYRPFFLLPDATV